MVIAERMGVREPDRPYIRELAEKLLYIGRGEHDRMKLLTEGMQGMIDYVSPLVDERIVNPGDDFISVLASGEKAGVFTRHQVLVNTSLLLLAGHETTINLLCNGTLSFIKHPDQWAKLKKDPAGAAKLATEECLRYDSLGNGGGGRARRRGAGVDPTLGCGNAMGERSARNVFRLTADRQSEAVDPDGDPVEKILEAAESCPMSAILVEDAETGEQLFP